MQIKLICSDIDGTLLNKDRELSKRTILAIKNVAPIPFILISSRMPKAMLHLQRELDISHQSMIAYNGGLIIDQDQVIHSTEIVSEVSTGLFQFCKTTNIHMSLYHYDEWYVPAMDYWANRERNNTKVTPKIQPIARTLDHWASRQIGAHKIMCMGQENEIDSLVSHIQSHYDEEIIGYRSKPTYLEISHRSISKKTALETLLINKYPDLRLDNLLAFGDNYNDIDMLKAVGTGVAVQNAIQEVLSIADKTTPANTADGVAVFLENLRQ
ncbi:MAG: Cof-type HAD-IIB family hydrolase [Flavobacteriaceae bacterium]|nr:Cof-type HAD-IIB family hydrolase [Flavobacteriaceae bacterium]